nr:NAD(P)H-hydrate dehydratase [uncultured Carboxylicivirga sp.]
MIKILNAHQIKGVDKATIDNEPISSIDLMERAAGVFYAEFTKLTKANPVVILAGPGNNGGDALAVARMLVNDGRKVRVFLHRSRSGGLSEDAGINLSRLGEIYTDIVLVDESTHLNLSNDEWVIDGLFGSGLNKPIEGVAANLIYEINSSGNKVVSIDVPSGLFCEKNSSQNLQTCIEADYTISFQMPKLSFLLEDNQRYVGKWKVLNIGLNKEAIEKESSTYFLIDTPYIRSLLKQRKKFDYKGVFGHALLMAGSYGKMGAAVIASKACMKSGVGLLTTHVPRLGYDIIQTAVPEVMASIDRSDILISEHPALRSYKAIGIGPGVGIKPNTITALRELLQEIGDKPLVLDADAINILGMDKQCWDLLPQNSIITPHLGEFDRLVGKSESSYERLQKAMALAEEKRIVVILKGAYTAVVDKDGVCYFNPTGNAGMATAGSGDVLTGIVLSLLAQGYIAIQAAQLAVYIHGLAGDEYLKDGAMESLIASDIVNHLSNAFRKLNVEHS